MSPLLKKKRFSARGAILVHLAWITAGLIALPMDTIRNRQVMAAGTDFEYESALDCARQVHKDGGIAAFYEGCKWFVAGKLASLGVRLGIQEAWATYGYLQLL